LKKGQGMKREECGTYQRRFNRLWGALAVSDCRAAGEFGPEMIAGIIGCSVDYARRLMYSRIRITKEL